MIEKIYADSEEKFVKANVLYAQADDGKLFLDSTYTVEVTKEQLYRAFLTGMIVVYNEATYKPVAYKEAADAGSVLVIDDTSAVASYTFYSTEHE